MGDNLIELSKKNPNKQIIGIELFLNGVASVVYRCVKSNINNILLYSHPVQVFLENYKKVFFKEIFILFPDPWPKKKHLKRRLLQLSFVKTLLERMEKNGKLYFATDNQNYFDEVQEHLNSDEIRKIPTSIKKLDPNELILTKYFLRAKRLKNKVSFLVIVKY
jgi:tRNA (guanine-N7-)-methyltransferase